MAKTKTVRKEEIVTPSNTGFKKSGKSISHTLLLRIMQRYGHSENMLTAFIKLNNTLITLFDIYPRK